MIVLSFIFNDADILEAREFMSHPFPDELCENLEDWIPNADVVFSIDEYDSGYSFRYAFRVPVVEFAERLNVVVHTIRVDETRLVDLTLMSCPIEFLRIDEEIVSVSRYGNGRHEALCLLSEFQKSSELFCSMLYHEISNVFPGYFEMMDRYPEGKEPREQSASQRTIGRLLLHS